MQCAQSYTYTHTDQIRTHTHTQHIRLCPSYTKHDHIHSELFGNFNAFFLRSFEFVICAFFGDYSNVHALLCLHCWRSFLDSSMWLCVCFFFCIGQCPSHCVRLTVVVTDDCIDTRCKYICIHMIWEPVRQRENNKAIIQFTHDRN